LASRLNSEYTKIIQNPKVKNGLNFNQFYYFSAAGHHLSFSCSLASLWDGTALAQVRHRRLLDMALPRRPGPRARPVHPGLINPRLPRLFHWWYQLSIRLSTFGRYPYNK
jgi:hypothetical protein